MNNIILSSLMNTDFSAYKTFLTRQSSANDLPSLTGKRQRSDSNVDDNTTSTTYTSDETGSRSPISSPGTSASYIAVKHLLSLDVPHNESVKIYLKKRLQQAGSKQKFAEVLSEFNFFDVFNEQEFNFLVNDLQMMSITSMARFRELQPADLRHFFKKCFETAESFFLNEWCRSSDDQTSLYIPGRFKNFHTTTLWESRLSRHQKSRDDYQLEIDFIHRKIHSQNWLDLLTAYQQVISYCPPSQIKQFILSCCEKQLIEPLRILLLNHSYRDNAIFDAVSVLCAKTAPAKESKSLAALFSQWAPSLSDDQMFARMRSCYTPFTEDVILEWLSRRINEYNDQFSAHKRRLQQQTSWHVNAPIYQEAVAFFEQMFHFLEHAVSWSAARESRADIQRNVILLIENHPFIRGDIKANENAIYVFKMLTVLLRANVNFESIKPFIEQKRYFDTKHDMSHEKNFLWREMLSYWQQVNPAEELFKQQLCIVTEAFGRFTDVKNTLSEKNKLSQSFIDLLLHTFSSYENVLIDSDHAWILEYCISHHFKLQKVRSQDASEALEAYYDYAHMEFFLKVMAAYSAQLTEPHDKTRILNYIIEQDFWKDRSGLTSFCLIVSRFAQSYHGQVPDYLHTDLHQELMTILCSFDILERMHSNTVILFLQSYHEHLKAVYATEPHKAKEYFLDDLKELLNNSHEEWPLRKDIASYYESISGQTLPQTAVLFREFHCTSPIGKIRVDESFPKPAQIRRIMNINQFPK